MALELIVSPFLEVLFDKLSSLISKEFRLLQGVNKDLEKLSSTLSIIKDVLVDAEVKQINDKRTRDWLTKLKDAAYDAEDIFEDCEVEALKEDSESGERSCSEQVSDSFSACFDFKSTIFRHKMGKRIKELIERFEEIDGERDKFQLSRGVRVQAVEEFSSDRETSSILTEPIVCGRDAEKESIIKILLANACSSNNLSICPILGIGGLGKTTLARVVYADERVVNQFDTKIWVCVSEDFGIKRITKMIIEHLSQKNCDLEALDLMQIQLKRLLIGRKYLLVLDDVWDDDGEKWIQMIHLLACGGKGSSVIVTTRLQSIVTSIATNLETIGTSTASVLNPTCNLKFLVDHESLSLFKHYAFGVGDEENQNLIDIGLEIIGKCGGLPLAIKAIGTLLHFKREEFWRLVRDSEFWSLEQHGENTILPALRLSYNYLPPVSRQCFAYCSMYPKDWIIKRDELINEWMANGLIQSSMGMEVEDIGIEVFNGLLQQSFLQIHEGNSTKLVECKMHDLMHDLACSVMKYECSRLKISDMHDVPQRARYISVMCDSPFSSDTVIKFSKSHPYLRTLVFFIGNSTNSLGLNLLLSHFSELKHLRLLDLGWVWTIKSVPSWIGQLKLLRFLSLENTGLTSVPTSVCSLLNLQVLLLGLNEFTTLPSSIGNLKNLRVLDLSKTFIKVLPESIYSLTNLQTLNLRGCSKLNSLPREMKKMTSLRHLIMEWHGGVFKVPVSSMPVGIGELTRLETLNIFVVSNSSEDAAGIQELGRLNLLKGRLLIKNIRHVQDPNNVQEANLKSKNKLSNLHLYWGEDDEYEEEEKTRSTQILDLLEPHPNLQILEILRYPGVEFPAWLRKCAVTIPNLRKLYFMFMPNAVHHLHVLPPNLKKLWIWGCPKLRLPSTTALPSSIEALSLEATNDPTLSSVATLTNLSKLQIGGFYEDEVLPEGPFRNLTRLRALYVSDCSRLKRLPTQLDSLAAKLKRLVITNCDELECITERELMNLTSLEELRIVRCWNLKNLSYSLQNLTSLKKLELRACPELDNSAIHFHQLGTLEELAICEMPQLTSLPDGIKDLTTLHTLVIEECTNIRSFPDWLQQHLPFSLCYLSIRRCDPELHRRCEMDNGEEWHKISHLKVVIEE
ncbi:hypothetical protein ACHQM5_022573 [Ranunculus cassubicifolius]